MRAHTREDAMKTKPLFAGEPSAPEVSVVGLGCNNFGRRCDEAGTKSVVNAALDAGITFFDTAESYGGGGKSEEFLGTALGTRRKDAFVATKFGYSVDASRKNILSSVEASLKRLGTDYIDLYQVHKPDPDTPIEETLETMAGLVSEGKVRFIGCSNYSGEQLDEARAASGNGSAPFVTAQNRYNLLHREIEADLVPACRNHGVGVLPFFPLASGLLTGKYRRGQEPPKGTRLGGSEHFAKDHLTDSNFDIVESLDAFAGDHGRSLLDLAISWLACQPEVTSVIAGATKPEQIEQNVQAADWTLSAEELAEVDRITRGALVGST